MIPDSRVSKALTLIRELESNVAGSLEAAARFGVLIPYTPFDEAALPPMPARTHRAAWENRCLAALRAHAQHVGELSAKAALALARIELAVRGMRSGTA